MLTVALAAVARPGRRAPVGARPGSAGRRLGLGPGAHRGAARRAPPGRAGHRPRLSRAALLRPARGDRGGHGPRMAGPVRRAGGGPTTGAPLGGFAVAVVYGQVVLGAFTTHGTAVWWHVARGGRDDGRPGRTTLAVLRGAREDPVLVWWARAVKVLVAGPAAPRRSAPTPFASPISGCRAGSSPSWPCRSCTGRVGALVLGSAMALALQLGRRRALGAALRAAPQIGAGPDGGRGVTTRTAVVRDGALALAGTRRRLADFLALAKPRVVLMVVLTTLVGYYLGASADLDLLRLVHVLVGTALAAGGTLALNQFLERDVDAQMLRTRARPLPDGRLQPGEAAAFGSLVTVAGLAYLAGGHWPRRRRDHRGHLGALPRRLHAAQAGEPALHGAGRDSRRPPAGGGLGGRPGRAGPGRGRALRHPVPLAAAAHARHRPALPGRLRARRHPRAAGGRPGRREHRAPDRDRLSRASRRRSPADPRRAHRGASTSSAPSCWGRCSWCSAWRRPSGPRRRRPGGSSSRRSCTCRSCSSSWPWTRWRLARARAHAHDVRPGRPVRIRAPRHLPTRNRRTALGLVAWIVLAHARVGRRGLAAELSAPVPVLDVEVRVPRGAPRSGAGPRGPTSRSAGAPRRQRRWRATSRAPRGCRYRTRAWAC